MQFQLNLSITTMMGLTKQYGIILSNLYKTLAPASYKQRKESRPAGSTPHKPILGNVLTLVDLTSNKARYTCLSILASGHFQLSSPWHECPNTCFSRTVCSLSRYNVKIELDCFNCKTAVFLRLFTSIFTKENNYNPRFCTKKSTRPWGIFNNYKEKLSVPRVHAAALIEAMFTLYRIVKRSVAESVPDRASVTLGLLLSKQFLLRNSTAPLRC